jgi:hypothetical protein
MEKLLEVEHYLLALYFVIKEKYQKIIFENS